MEIIKKNSLNNINFKSVYSYRSFIYLLFLRNIATIYKQTILGPFWQILIPVIQSGLFTLVFSKIAKLSTDEIPPFLFYSSAMLAWIFFQSTWLKTSDTFLNFAGYIRNAFIPKITIVAALILENIFILTVNILIFLIIYIYHIILGYELKINFILLIFLPVVIIFLSCLASSIGLLIACLSAKFRDLKFISQYGIQIVFYVTPIVYSVNSIPEKYQYFFYLNPLTFYIDFFRSLFFSSGELNMNYFYSSFIMTIVVFTICLKIYKNTIGNVVDYV
jgi:lipopolysaccharide transport system permease protein